ncbi:hypothetical protein [Nonomuraea lactucae]|uniref:hypothetical protein n=1 Tax=Nonomuraea lactucae TaxID=2249762 RepID=UPI0013B36435|nr:hypothetical protein [Nonomuraea lactucae]
MNSNRKLYILPLICGWIALAVGGCAIMLEVAGPNNAITFSILLAIVVLSLLLTAVVVAIAEMTASHQR